MKALIIAAGEGKRIRDVSKDLPKPLTPLLGLSLIERVILSLKSVDIKDFVIVIGYKGEEIKEKLGNGRNYGVRLEYVENKNWKKGNGISVLCGREKIKGNFILVMADHIFDVGIVKDLLKRKLDCFDGLLAVDRERREYLDIEDATKVKIKDSKILNIGKNLDDFDGIDCGIFLLNEKIFEAIEESIDRGDDTLSGGIRVLAEKGRMGYMEVGERFWIDIDTKESLKVAEEHLLKSLIKPTDGFISRYINRKISTRISKFLVRFDISPNAISVASFFASVFAAFIFALGGWIYTALAGILAQFSSIIDGCDGEVARLKFKESDYGAWMDSVLDRYADAFIFLGMIYGYWLSHHNYDVWLAGFFACLGSILISYTAVKYDQLIKERKAKFRIGRDFRLFVIMVGGLINQIMLALIFLAILTNAENVRRILVISKKVK